MSSQLVTVSYLFKDFPPSLLSYYSEEVGTGQEFQGGWGLLIGRLRKWALHGLKVFLHFAATTSAVENFIEIK